MKQKMLAWVCAAALCLSLSGCAAGSPSSSAPSSASAPAPVSDSTDALSDLEAIGEVDVEQELFDVIITLPAELAGETTQEQLEQQTEGQDIHSVTLNEDGSVTYVMSKRQHKAFMEDFRASLSEELAQIPGSEGFENITSVEANEDFTSFTVTTAATELSLSDMMSVMVYYTYGGIYNIFNGTPADNVHVDFVNADTGELINSSDSSDMAE